MYGWFDLTTLHGHIPDLQIDLPVIRPGHSVDYQLCLEAHAVHLFIMATMPYRNMSQKNQYIFKISFEEKVNTSLTMTSRTLKSIVTSMGGFIHFPMPYFTDLVSIKISPN